MMQQSEMKNIARSSGHLWARTTGPTSSSSYMSLLPTGAHQDARWPGLQLALVHGGETIFSSSYSILPALSLDGVLHLDVKPRS